MYLLNDEKLHEFANQGFACPVKETDRDDIVMRKRENAVKVVAKAQAQKIRDKMNELCPHSLQIRFIKLHCPRCWQAFCEEIDAKG